MRFSGVLVSLVLLVACSAQPHLRKEKAHWEQLLSDNVPPGTTREQFIRWLSSQGITPTKEIDSSERITPQPATHPHEVSAKVEDVTDRFSLVCSYWIIRVRVFFDDVDRSVRNEVETVGTCL